MKVNLINTILLFKLSSQVTIIASGYIRVRLRLVDRVEFPGVNKDPQWYIAIGPYRHTCTNFCGDGSQIVIVYRWHHPIYIGKLAGRENIWEAAGNQTVQGLWSLSS